MPAYTLEMLDNCDIDRLIPFYLFDYRKALRAKNKAEKSADIAADDTNIVIRGGKKYRKVTADKTSWADKIF